MESYTMWIMVEVKEPNDVGKNELRRLKLSDKFIDIKSRCEYVCNIRIVYDITSTGVEVHPATEQKENYVCSVCGKEMIETDSSISICPDYPHNAQEEYDCSIDDSY